MTEYTIEAPDSRRYKIDAPEGATEQMAMDWFKQSWADGSVTSDMALPETSMWEEFKAGYSGGYSDVNNASLWLESKMPLGTLLRSPREMYGDEFMDMEPEQRRQALLRMREEEHRRENQAVYEAGQEDSGAAIAGSFAGVLATPTSLAPVGHGYKSAAMVGGLLGAEHNALQQLADTGEVSPAEVGLYAGAGALFTPIALYLGRAFGSTVGKIRAKRADKKLVESANQTVNKIEEELVIAVNDKVPAKDLGAVVSKATGLTAKEMKEAVNVAGRKPKVPTSKEAKIVADSADPYVAPSRLKKAASATGAFVDDYIGVLSTRIKGLSETAFGRLRQYEFNSHVKSHDALKKVDPFLIGLKKLPEKAQNLVAKQLANGDFNDAKAVMQQHNPELVKEFGKVDEVLKGMYTELKEAGYDKLGRIENYFPRYVTDVDSLFSKFGKQRQSLLEVALERKATQLGLKSAESIPKAERIDVANKVLRGYLPKTQEGKLGFSKIRSIDRLTDDMMQDYASPAEALHTYLRRAIMDVEKRKFFGKGAAVEGGKIDLNKSIGNMIQKEMSEGMSPADADTLTSLLQGRFGLGEQSPNAMIQGLRNIGHMTTIANPYSAATQIGDLGVSAYVNGLRNTMASMFGKRNVKMEDFGLEDVIAEEFATTGATAKALNKMFTWSGFRSVDKFGKTTVLNSALRKGWAQAKNPRGQAKLTEKYGKVFGSEFKGLMDDLSNGRVTENVKLYLWNELSDVQPISLSEMPLKYLEAPNGRIMYTLKTFAIRQLDLLRRDVAQEYAKGNRAAAVANAARYATLVGFTGATVDQAKGFMSGEGLHVDNIPDDMVKNIFKTFGASQYIRDKYLDKGQAASALLETIAPPIDWIDAIGTDIINIASGDEDIPKETMRSLPLIGRAWYMFFGGGLERANQRELDEMFEE